MALRGQLRVAGQGQVAPGLEARRLQRRHAEAVGQGREVLDIQGLADYGLQLTQGRIEVVRGLDLLGLGEVMAGTGLQQVGAGALAGLEQALVELQLLGVGAALGLREGDLLVGEQRLAIGVEQAHRQLLAAAAQALVGQQRLGLALAVFGPGGVVEQRLLQGEGGGVAAVVALAGDVAGAVDWVTSESLRPLL